MLERLEERTGRRIETVFQRTERSREPEIRSKSNLQIPLKTEDVPKRGGSKEEPVERSSEERSRNQKEERDKPRNEIESPKKVPETKLGAKIVPET